MTDWKNTTPIEHTCSNGTTFSCSCGDLSDVVHVWHMWHITDEQRCADFMEFGAWHALWIHPHLNGFSGYDAVVYRCKEMPED